MQFSVISVKEPHKSIREIFHSSELQAPSIETAFDHMHTLLTFSSVCVENRVIKTVKYSAFQMSLIYCLQLGNISTLWLRRENYTASTAQKRRKGEHWQVRVNWREGKQIERTKATLFSLCQRVN